jgi:hypothetical protein
LLLLPPVVLVAPDLFQKAALFQIIDEAVIVDFFGFLSDGAAHFAGEVDGFGDRFAG